MSNSSSDRMPASVERASPAPLPTEPVLVSLPWLLAVLLRHRRAVLAGALAGVLVAVLIAAVRPRLYTATFSFLPQTSLEQPGGGLASLAGQFGFPVAMLGGKAMSRDSMESLPEIRRGRRRSRLASSSLSWALVMRNQSR